MADQRRTIYETHDEKGLFKKFSTLAKKLRRSFNFCVLDAMRQYLDKGDDTHGEV